MNRKILSGIAAAVILAAAGCGNSTPAATTASQTTTSAPAVTTTAEEEDFDWLEAFEDEDTSDYDADDNDSDADDNSSDYNETNSSGSGYPYDPYLGTAKELDGNIAVVSIFADTPMYSWEHVDIDFSAGFSYYTDGLAIACDYIEEKCREFGHSPNFIYDWSQYPGLACHASLDYDCLDLNGIDYESWDYIENNIDTAAILKETGAEQIIYMLLFNTPIDCTTPSATRGYYYGAPYPYELCYMRIGYNGYMLYPGTIAHEMLHAFGAPDLYMADEYGITREYVDYIAQNGLNDIMRINWDPETGIPLYDRINNEITDITAYYLGLTDYSETVQEWGFEPSQHVSD